VPKGTYNTHNYLKRLLLILLLLTGFSLQQNLSAQSGGRKREKRIKVKRRGDHILTQYKSRGNADQFANGSSGRRGRFAKLFYRPKKSWQYKRSGSKASHNRDNRDLFSRERQKGHVSNTETQHRSRVERARERDYGNRSFRRKKYNRK